jgi:hypothetical protein
MVIAGIQALDASAITARALGRAAGGSFASIARAVVAPPASVLASFPA